MRKRRTITALAALVMFAGALLLVRMGVTLAADSNVIRVTNTVQTGAIGLEVSMLGEDATNMEPGLKVYKDPRISNTGDFGVYVRVRIDVAPEPEMDVEELIEDLQLAVLEDWLEGDDGYWYYTEVLDGGDEIGLFQNLGNPNQPYTMVLPGKWTQETAPKRITINVAPQAVQADNFEPDFEGGGLWNGVGME